MSNTVICCWVFTLVCVVSGSFRYPSSFCLCASLILHSGSFINWAEINNPVLQYANWSIKDDFIQYNQVDKLFYVFFSAFYQDNGEIRSHGMYVSANVPQKNNIL